MTAIEALVRTPVAQGLGWALAHSLWQGGALALIVGATLGATRSARTRYAVACLALLVMVVAFAWTWSVSVPEIRGQAVPVSDRSFRVFDPVSGIPTLVRERAWSTVVPWLVPFWVVGVLAFHLRALAGWNATRRIRSVGVCAPPRAWNDRLTVLAARMRVSRPVTLLESGLAKAPVVAGYLRPVILIPAGVLAGLPTAQLEAILLHELAHIRRRDYLVNMIQMWVEPIFFYHPAIWWISKVVRIEREHCCDDLVVASQGNALQYAAALAALEEYRWSAEPAVAATGGSLVKRIRRLLHQPEGPRAIFAPALTATILTFAAAAALFAWQDTPRKTAQREVRRVPLPATVERPYKKWIQEDVAYIIQDQEREAFLALRTDEEREMFIVQFWTRRDPTPGTVENEMKEEHYRRIAYSNQRFADSKVAGWKTDRGRIYIVYGPPDQIEAHPADPVPNEEWLYRFIQGIGENVIVRFEDPDRSGAYRQTVDPRNPRMVK